MPRHGASKIRISFSSAQLSHFGGIYLLHQFLRRLGFRTFLSHAISYFQRNNRYTLSEFLIALMYPMILGLEKIEVSALLGTNGVFQYIAVHDDLRAHFICLPATPSSFWLDCDSTAHTLYGNQEGAVKGYNPGHPGKKSYHPLVITEAHGGDCLAGVLRPGNAHTATGVIDLVSNVLDFLPHHHRIRLRADAGFYNGNFVDYLKGENITFAIVAHLTPALKRRLGALRYARISPVFSVATFRYQPHGWDSQERFVALRRKLPDETAEAQTTLFTLDRYAYSVIVTNLTLEPYNVFRYYQERAAMERIIRTLKEDYPFGQAPTNAFDANALYAELSLLAYNLMTWF
ncbi:MAG: transposase, partial [Candidatus Magasanikbacteria bacterium]|nr:transposase [Candidatus Magasanikbacteria bacterium]